VKKGDFVQMGVVAVGSAATSFALAFMVKLGIKQESLFALVGALIGAAATVGGAAWLAERNRNYDRDSEVTLLTNEFRRLLIVANSTREAEPTTATAWSAEYRALVHRLAEEAGKVHAIAEEAIAHGKSLSFIHRTAVRTVKFAIDEYLTLYLDSNAEEVRLPLDERSFPIATSEIADRCQIAICELNRTKLIAENHP
jgi:uncharacterized membrane protein YgaE (UPF0421/DUF939 family)